MSDENQIWDECMPALERLEPETSLGQMVLAEETESIGIAMESLLMQQMANGEHPGGVVLGLTKTEIAKIHVGHETHSQRMWASRLAGRFFANELTENLEYIVQIMPVWEGTDDHEGPVKDNPHRTEAAMVVVMELKSLYEAKNLDEYTDALNSPCTFGWYVKMHEGLATHIQWDGANLYPSCQQPEGYEKSDDPTADHYIDNFGMTEILVGLSAALPVIQMITASEELQRELDRQVGEKELQEAKMN